MMAKLFAIGFGGCIGAVLRYWMSAWVLHIFKGSFPAGTLAVNVLGSFLLGLIIAFFEQHPLQSNLMFFLTTGLMGAFTTFSTFSYEAIVLMQTGAQVKAAAYVVLSVVVGISAAFGGFYLGKAL